MRKVLAMLLCFGLLIPFTGAAGVTNVSAKTYAHNVTCEVKGVDCTTGEAGGLAVYPAGSTARRLYSKEYKFRNSYLMVFNKEGRLAELGANLLEENGVQLSVVIPAGGFLIAFPYSGYTDLYQAFTVAQEGAMFYNATFTAAYEMFGEYDAENKKVTVRYDDPAPVPSDAIKFLFIGNSSTYVNASPLKFRELAKAAGKNVDVTYCTEGSAYLEYFAEGGQYSNRFKTALSKKQYDYVVLQDAAASDFSKASKACDNLIPQILANGATPVFYMRYYSDKSSCYELTDKYFTLYEALARKYGTVYAPAVVAFLRCQERYPSINLYADDASHHSKEGSYLIGATMLYAFLGISPVGNSYTADIDASTVAALQECAASAVEEPYYPDVPFADFEENGIVYTNVARNKTYTRTGTPYSHDQGKWIDFDPDKKKLIGKMTDGFAASAGDDNSIGAYKGSEGVPTDVVIDLEQSFSLKRFETDLYGGTWGIENPKNSSVTVSVSEDGTAFTAVGSLTCSKFKTSGNWTYGLFTLDLPEAVQARYVKFSYLIGTEVNKLCLAWSSEAAVFGALSEGEIRYGDLNKDGELDAVDYIRLKKGILKDDLSESEKKIADFNRDGEVDALDYIALKKAILSGNV